MDAWIPLAKIIMPPKQTRSLPPSQTLLLVQGWHAQKITPQQIAANLNLMHIPNPRGELWTMHSVQVLLKKLRRKT